MGKFGGKIGQIGKFENCAGDFLTWIKMMQIACKFELTMCIFASHSFNAIK